MVVGEALGTAEGAGALNQRIKQHVRGNWLHNFEVDAGGNITTVDSFAHRRKGLEHVFSSLLVDRSVVVLDEVSGLYPALIHRSGARAVSACNPNQGTCDLIGEVLGHLCVPATVIKSKLMAFYSSEPYVDQQYGQKHEFLLALGQIWPLFGASGESFDAIVEACAYFVTDGLVFDWTDAKWASPPPPAEYNLTRFRDALLKKFEYVICADWLVVAAGKLPLECAVIATAPGGVEQAQTTNDTESIEPICEEDQAEPDQHTHLPPTTAVDGTNSDNSQPFLTRYREAVYRVAPPGAIMAVVSKGGDELLVLEARTGWHFPQHDDGSYLGYHPLDSGSAISHLEELRAKGAEFLVFPEPYLWWLDHYREFQLHLESNYARLPQEGNTCVVFELRATPCNEKREPS